MMLSDTQPPPAALTIAGSDCSAGAGAQADLKTFSACGVYGLSAVTCVVSELPERVEAIEAVSPDLVSSQVRICFDGFPVGGVKTGMLFSQPIVEAVADCLEGIFAELGDSRPALIVDPVMVASSGDALLEDGAVAAYEEKLFPLAALITPNLDEAARLLGETVSSREAMLPAAEALSARHGCGVLLKGGHLREDTAHDLLLTGPGAEPAWFSAPFLRSAGTHGTGCTFSAAIAAGCARGLGMREAVGEAKDYITRAIRNAHTWPAPSGGHTGLLNHGA